MNPCTWRLHWKIAGLKSSCYQLSSLLNAMNMIRMLGMIRFLAFFILALFATGSAFAQSAPPLVTAQQIPHPAPMTPPPVVLELFTSQGCAFCPPADGLMGQMALQPGIIGLSCHVDYFNVRKNSLGQGFCTKRQNEYNLLIGKGPRYTPQLVINGHMDMIGYEGGKISAAVLKARSEKIFSISLTKVSEGAFTYNLPQTDLKGASIKLWLAVYDAPHNLTMTEGGNFGKKITYYNVVSRMQDLGAWDGASSSRGIDASLTPKNEGIAILAQDVNTGRIIGAGSLKR
jgi:hypothetical protein